MATASMSQPRAPWFRAKNLLFACLALMALYVIRHNEHFIIDRTDPFWQHIQTFKWWLLAHGLAGACALLLAPLQFSDRLRQRLTKMHRVVGRVYITGVFILAPLGAYIEYLEERIGGTRSETIGTVVFAILLMSTTSIALFFILNRKIQQHRQWMTRSFAIALVFFEVRAITGIFRLDDNVAAGDTIFWSCLVLAIPLADLVLQLQESRRARTPAAAPRHSLGDP
jgi:FtsH-binding integral membrane protein